MIKYNIHISVLLLLYSNYTFSYTITEDNSTRAQQRIIQNFSSSCEQEGCLFKKPKEKTDTALLINVSLKILDAVKKRNYDTLASFIHPEYGVLFSPYAYIDTTDSQVLLPDRLIQISKQMDKINWGSAWDQGMEPELLTIDEYFSKHVYDVDFLNAPVVSINEFKSRGTDLNNIKDIFPECNVVEFFFPGFEEKNEGMDFRGLRLIFQFYNNRPCLVAIVHDEWTP